MTTPTPGNTTVTQGSSGGILSDIGGYLNTVGNYATLGLLGAAEAPAVSAYEGLKTGITDTTSGVEAVANVAVQGAEWMANPHNWIRVCMVIGGSVIIILGVYLAFRNTGAGNAAKGAGGAVQAGNTKYNAASNAKLGGKIDALDLAAA